MHRAVRLALSCCGSFWLCHTGSERAVSGPYRIRTCWRGHEFFMPNAFNSSCEMLGRKAERHLFSVLERRYVKT